MAMIASMLYLAIGSVLTAYFAPNLGIRFGYQILVSVVFFVISMFFAFFYYKFIRAVENVNKLNFILFQKKIFFLIFLKENTGRIFASNNYQLDVFCFTYHHFICYVHNYAD
jgi:hypothetical protein